MVRLHLTAKGRRLQKALVDSAESMHEGSTRLRFELVLLFYRKRPVRERICRVARLSPSFLEAIETIALHSTPQLNVARTLEVVSKYRRMGTPAFFDKHL